MRQIFIGDVQGCCSALERLLDRLDFDPAGDRLLFCGDLVNRGGRSLDALSLVHGLGSSAMTVLGNHDLHLLAYALGPTPPDKPNPEFEAILNSSGGEKMLDWLRRQPVLWADADQRLAMIHAGIDPRWDPALAGRLAGELEAVLAGPDHAEYFANMYGNRPRRWKPEQSGYKALRAITNVFTRMRFCDPEGRLEFDYKGGLDGSPAGVFPWFRQLHPAWSDWTIVFGHWSLLGLHMEGNVIGLDTGCVWGKTLTALVLPGDGTRQVVQVACD